MLGLHCSVGAFSSCVEQMLPFVAVCGLLMAVASLLEEDRLWAHGLSTCGIWA